MHRVKWAFYRKPFVLNQASCHTPSSEFMRWLFNKFLETCHIHLCDHFVSDFIFSHFVCRILLGFQDRIGPPRAQILLQLASLLHQEVVVCPGNLHLHLAKSVVAYTRLALLALELVLCPRHWKWARMRLNLLDPRFLQGLFSLGFCFDFIVLSFNNFFFPMSKPEQKQKGIKYIWFWWLYCSLPSTHISVGDGPQTSESDTIPSLPHTSTTDVQVVEPSSSAKVSTFGVNMSFFVCTFLPYEFINAGTWKCCTAY